MAHTPGPWLAIKNRDVGTVDYRVAVIMRNAPIDEVADANARLITAAPELLAALVRMLDCHQAAMDAAQSNASQYVDKRCDCGACDEARAAIAKAEGRS